MENNQFYGNCRFCHANMTAKDDTCSYCGRLSDECFISKGEQKESLKATRKMIVQNIIDSLKAKRWF